MEIMLTIIAILGGLLFIFSYLKFVLSGFRYHPITGLLAFIPVINLITVPTLMDDKLVRTILFGFIGLILAIGAWFLGADKSLQKHISTLRGEPIIISSSKQKLMGGNKEAISTPDTTTAKKITTAEGSTTEEVTATDATTEKEPQSVYFEELPKHALYSMEFIETSVQQINTLKGRVVRITSTSNTVTEGQIQNIEKGSVFISKNGEGNIAYEMLIGNIKQLLVMVKRKK